MPEILFRSQAALVSCQDCVELFCYDCFKLTHAAGTETQREGRANLGSLADGDFLVTILKDVFLVS